MRTTTSVGPPAANGTTIFTGLVGKSMAACADALDAAAASSRAHSKARAVVARTVVMGFPLPARRVCHLASTDEWTRESKRKRGRGGASRAPVAPRKTAPGRNARVDKVRLQPVEDLIGPEPLEPVQRLVQRRELVGTDATDLLDRANVLLIKRLDDIAHLATLVGEADADRAAIDARTLMVEEAHLDELLEVVGD